MSFCRRTFSARRVVVPRNERVFDAGKAKVSRIELRDPISNEFPSARHEKCES